MNWLIRLFEFNMVKPELYGWFHILCLVLTVLLVVVLLKLKTNEKENFSGFRVCEATGGTPFFLRGERFRIK